MEQSKLLVSTTAPRKRRSSTTTTTTATTKATSAGAAAAAYVQPRELSFLCVVFLSCAAVLTVQQIRHTRTVLFRGISLPREHSNDQDHGTDGVNYQAFLLPLEQQRLLQITKPHRPSLARARDDGGGGGGAMGGTHLKPRTSISSLSLPHEPLPPLETMPQSLAAALRTLVEQRLARHERVTLVQVGANDGVTNDPLYKELVTKANTFATTTTSSAAVTDWRPYFMALQIEPQPQLYQQLYTINSPSDWYYYNGVVVAPPTNHPMTNATVPQCLNGTIAFCETKSPGVGDWKTQGQVNSVTTTKCTNRRKALHQHMTLVHRRCVSSWTDLLNAAAAAAVAVAVTATTISGTATGSGGDDAGTLEEKQTLFHDALDFLQVDTEGHDLAILQMVLNTTPSLRPLCIHYEHWGARQAAIDLLQQHGYTVVAERPKANDRLACRV
jgi:Methyltransferase FkbM domain